jgi:hypothetical protein
MAQHAGAPQKFHYTITIAWARLVAAACCKSDSCDSFCEWIKTHPQFLNRYLLKEHYSAGKLEPASPLRLARSGFEAAGLNKKTRRKFCPFYLKVYYYYRTRGTLSFGASLHLQERSGVDGSVGNQGDSGRF